MATRTTTTWTIPSEPALSADETSTGHADFSIAELAQAYIDCRRTKRNSRSALDFEQRLEYNLATLYDEIESGTYRPGPSICFVITRPKPREVWAADFRDRIVHHLLHNRIAPRFCRAFIADSCACIQGRGTLYAARRLEHKVRSITRNWSRPAHYLKIDLANFFIAIDKRILRTLLAERIPETWWRRLTELILLHDPRRDAVIQSTPELLARIPAHKSLFNQPDHLGLPIGNLSSQFFANVYLNELDQHVKHTLRARHYVRYVDDIVILHESPQWLNHALAEITAFLRQRLNAELNPAKTILQPIERGIDFVGHLIKPWRRTLRRRTYRDLMTRIDGAPFDELPRSANSYFGLLRQTTHSHHDRARLANILLRRRLCVDRDFTRTP